MIATGHNGVGALVGITVISLQEGYDLSAPWVFILALCLGIISHYLADCIPHGHIFSNSLRENLRKIIFIDLFGTFLVIVLASWLRFGLTREFFIIMFAILGAQLPDVLGALEYLGHIRIRGPLLWEYRLHQYIAHWHGYEQNGLPWRNRDIWQILLYLASILVIYNF